MNKHILGTMLASSLVLASLAGCSTPNPAKPAPSTGTTTTPATGGTPNTQSPATGTTSPTTGSAATGSTATDTGTEAAAAMAEERDMDDYGNLAEQEDPSAPAAYATLATADAAATGDASATGTAAPADLDTAVTKVKSGKRLTPAEQRAAIKAAVKIKVTVAVKKKVQDRIKERLTKNAKRLDKLANQRQKMRDQLKSLGWADNGDGTSTKSISFDDTRTANGKTVTRKATISRTRQNDTKALVSWHAEFDQTLPNGLHRVSTRDKVLQEDGSYLVTFHSELTFPNGSKRTADWTKTISADGGVTGTGTIVWTNKDGKTIKTANITLSGDEDAPKCKDDGGKAAVTLPADGDAQVTTDAGASTTEPADSVAVDANVDVTAGSADAAATADATASAAG